MKLINKVMDRAGVGFGLALVAASSQAAIDVSAATAALADGITAISTIGGAVLALWGTKKVFSMVHGG